MKRFEWRVYWVRNGVARSRILQNERAARRRLGWLTAGWDVLGLDPNEPWCCPGAPQCDCRGETNAQRWHREMEEWGRVSEARLEQREVGEWQTLDVRVAVGAKT